MTGKGGSTSAPPALNHQKDGEVSRSGLRAGMHQSTDKTPAWGVHASHHEGVNDRAPRLEGNGPAGHRKKRGRREKPLRTGFMLPIMKG
jgi:hypothetical protein